MKLRDEIALMAAEVFLEKMDRLDPALFKTIAEQAYQFADQMIAAAYRAGVDGPVGIPPVR